MIFYLSFFAFLRSIPPDPTRRQIPHVLPGASRQLDLGQRRCEALHLGQRCREVHLRGARTRHLFARGLDCLLEFVQPIDLPP